MSKPTYSPRFELWAAVRREDEYTHMVYDLRSEDCRWFRNREDAEAYMKVVPDVRRKSGV